MGNYIGREYGGSPTSDLFPLSAASASSPFVSITATTATGGGTVVHTGDLNALDILYVTVSNVSASTLVAYGQLGSLATTGTVQLSLNAGTSGVLFNGNAPISKSGVAGIWTTASTGLTAYGFIARTYTATS
jgi:hypothetical protein